MIQSQALHSSFILKLIISFTFSSLVSECLCLGAKWASGPAEQVVTIYKQNAVNSVTTDA